MNIPFITFYNHLQLVKGFNSRATKIMERSLAVLTWWEYIDVGHLGT
jgi:hypothetical protein